MFSFLNTESVSSNSGKKLSYENILHKKQSKGGETFNNLANDRPSAEI